MTNNKIPETDQQQVYRTIAAIAASGCTPEGEWLKLFRTNARSTLGQNLVKLLKRVRQRQNAEMLTPAPHDRLENVRDLMDAEGIEGLLVGHDDENLNEYICPSGARLQWLTGFRGSAGLMLVLPEAAYLFVDGRYTLQAPQEIDPHFVQVRPLTPQALAETLAENMPVDADWRIGCDAALFTASAHRRMQKNLAAVGARLQDVTHNLIDLLWQEQPHAPFSPINRVTEAAETTTEKLTRLCAILQKKHCDSLVIQAPEDILWLLNIRASDIATAPFCLSKMIVHAEGSIDWFLSPEKLALAEQMSGWQKTFLHPEQDFIAALTMLANAGSQIWLDPSRTSARVIRMLEQQSAKIHEAQDPIWSLAACLNEAERSGARAAHLRDGCALVEFMAAVAFDPEPCQESDLAQRLQEFRAEQKFYQQDSFHAIVAARGNSAQCHYRPIPDADDQVRWGDIVLIDSGAHYLDGTTDVTRMLAYDQGEVPLSAEFRRHYTLVLQSLIAISSIRFPKGTTGMALDAIARRGLWQHGLDYDHGTGHGVGSNSMVHFGPQRIAKNSGAEPLRVGMILSLEPGVYLPHQYGIRLENLGLVAEDAKGWLYFENLTWVPFVRRMIDTTMLNGQERTWLNNYHAEVYRRLARNLSPQSARWLAEATKVL